MRKLVPVSILFLFSIPVMGQVSNGIARLIQNNFSGLHYPSYKVSPSDHYQGNFKLESMGYIPGAKMQKTGKTLTIIGGICVIGGTALMLSADELYYSSTTVNGNTVEEGDPRGGFGVVLTAVGVGMTVTGIILWSKGSKKVKLYKEQQVSLNIKGAGLSLALKL